MSLVVRVDQLSLAIEYGSRRKKVRGDRKRLWHGSMILLDKVRHTARNEEQFGGAGHFSCGPDAPLFLRGQAYLMSGTGKGQVLQKRHLMLKSASASAGQDPVILCYSTLFARNSCPIVFRRGYRKASRAFSDFFRDAL